jgi:lipoprotein-releasing system permease protein
MSFPLLVALRFLKEGRAQSVLIVAGVGVGVAVMVFLSALIDGLQKNLVRQTLGTQAHVVVRTADDEARPQVDAGEALVAGVVERPPQRLKTIPSWPNVVREVQAVAGVVAVTPTISGSGFAGRGSATKPVILRGVDPETYNQVIPVAPRLVEGQFALGGVDAVIGVELARELGVKVGDKIRLINAQGRSVPYSVRGVFDLQNKDVNQRWVLVSLRSAQTLLDLSGDVTSIEVKVEEIFDAELVSMDVAQRTGLVADSWMKLNQQLLVALRSQSSSSQMIQFFVIVAVAFGIASVLAVSVVQKSKEIGILKAMGARTQTITRVFLIQGFLVGVVGSAMGLVMGSGLALFFASVVRNADGSPTFPIEVTGELVVRSALIAAVVGVLAAVAPARRAARLDPAVVIRYG